MKRLLSFLCAIVILLSLSTAYCSEAMSFSYDVHFSVDDSAISMENFHAKDWKTFLEKIKIEGNGNFNNLFQKNEIINDHMKFYLTNKKLLDIIHSGNQQYKWIVIPQLSKEFFLNFGNYYEFMLKGYFFLGLKSQFLALGTYPFGAFSAINNVREFITYNIIDTDKDIISYDKLLELAKIMKGFLESYPSTAQFIRSGLVDSGIYDLMYYDFQTADEYLYSIANGQDMKVTKEDTKKIYSIGEHEIIVVDDKGNEKEYKIHLPESTNGLEYFANYKRIKTEKTYSMKMELSVNMDEMPYIAYTIEANELPLTLDAETNSSISVRMYGEAVAEEYTLNFKLNADKENDRNIYTLSYIDPKTQKEAITAKINIKLNSYEGEPDSIVHRYIFDDFFSLNTESLKTLKEDIIRYIKSAALPIIVETPAGVMEDVLQYIRSKGIIDVFFAK